jgi:hypothetical protein
MHLILALAAAPLSWLAPAQSLHQTHELVWAPSGKTPIAHWRMRSRPACTTGGHHQAGKAPLAAPRACTARR